MDKMHYYLHLLILFWLSIELCSQLEISIDHLQDLENEVELPYIHYSENNSMSFTFSSCSSGGRFGPTQAMCDVTYKHSSLHRVRVLESGWLTGVQVWIVPQTGVYSLTGIGAAGGTGLYNKGIGFGDFVTARFNLVMGDTLYVLVGQKGEDACKHSNTDSRISRLCRQGLVNYTMTSLMTSQSRNISELSGGGGGGGGASYVFKLSEDGSKVIPLIIAAGAGGKSALVGPNDVLSDGGALPPGPGNSSSSSLNGPGGGGGLHGQKIFDQDGGSLMEGGLGGTPCLKASGFGWVTSGGFGGGGGGCSGGGAGGGFTGGKSSLMDEANMSGQGGSSFIHKNGSSIRTTPGSSGQNGLVEIKYIIDCPCQYYCNIQSVDDLRYTCECRSNEILAEDGLHCIGRTELNNSMNRFAVVAVVVGSLLLVIVILVVGAIFIAVQRRLRHKAEKLLRLTSVDRPLIQLGQVSGSGSVYRVVTQGGRDMVSAFNPNYGLCANKLDALKELTEIPREKLQFIKTLGQGAFGEVFEGRLDTGSVLETYHRVAAKTLTAITTEQAEMDFLLEAIIMSKFNHRNIVRLIGVCFEHHPRIIVLELLEGGDLKSFLREARPSPEKYHVHTLADLTQLALDIAHGCEYLEKQHFIHRDIAARNCLLTSKEAGRICKIGDFGMSRDIYRADYYRKGGQVMLPVKWMPPEAFLDGVFTCKTDVWSFGVLLWEIFSLGYMPYPGRENHEVMQFVTRGGRLEPPLSCPSSVVNIMKNCWEEEPDKRLGFSVITASLEKGMEDDPTMKERAGLGLNRCLTHTIS